MQKKRPFFNNVPHLSRWSGVFAFHLHGGVFSLGEQAALNSEYAQARRELWTLLESEEPNLAKELSSLLNPIG